MCTSICAASAPPVGSAEAALRPLLSIDRLERRRTTHPVLLTLHEHRQQQQAHRTTHRRRLIVRSALVAPKTLRRCAPQSELPDGITFFHSAATCLHLPARLTRESTKREGRKPRASERHVVGCCEVLTRSFNPFDEDTPALLLQLDL